MPESKFLKIKCPRCSTQHITFGKATTRIKCRSCNKLLVKLTGGKVKIKAPIKEVI
ncbi:30S ribosomal protein S27e [Candidatus Pacearchaeota archaeon CG_4_9_14_0_2_um_filter_39_13]|nr:30S ribosomal protein S27e [Candidatus Pacearchaeota archaeon]PJC44568.1 MAG: 30S ribosomal protein S27e [Candidatus Pacearchaeota archaeon CG_4_9_14_0_2_um_filter_39_13]